MRQALWTGIATILALAVAPPLQASGTVRTVGPNSLMFVDGGRNGKLEIQCSVVPGESVWCFLGTEDKAGLGTAARNTCPETRAE